MAWVICLAGVACESTPECGPGTRLVDGACVAACGAGTEPEAGSGRCLPVCAEGTFLDDSSGTCLPNAARCASDELWDPAAGACVASFCAPGSTWSSARARCVPDAELRPPDHFEGPGFNDHGHSPPVCERIVLPEPGAPPVSIGGRIDAPTPSEAVKTTLHPDLDCWSFEAPGPTLLRIVVDGRGGAAPGLEVNRLGDASFAPRLALGQNDRPLHREVYLPVAGTYDLTVTDALNLMAHIAAYRGGGDLGYYAELSVRPLPEPIPLELRDGRAVARGVFSTGVPDGDSEIRLFSLAGGPEELFELRAHTPVPGISIVASGIAGNGTPFDAGVGERFVWPLAFDTPGEAVFAVDFDRSHRYERVPWELRVERRPLEVMTGPTLALEVDQPAFRHDEPIPWRYVGFRASVGEVAVLRFGSSTGFTCVEIWTLGFDALDGDAQCYGGSPAQPELELRFHPTYDGLYIAKFYDWSQGFVDGSSLLAMPPVSFGVDLALYHEQPLDLGDLSRPWASTETLDPIHWERYLSLAPNPGDSFWLEIDGRDGFEPLWASYWIEPDRWAHSLYPLWFVLSSRLAYRSVDGDPLLLGVSNLNGRSGTFDLRARRIDLTDLGTVGPLAPVASSHLLAAGEERRFVKLEIPAPGWLDFSLQSSAADLWVVPLAQDLTELVDLATPTRGADGPVRIVGPLAGPLLLELLPVEADTLPRETTVTVNATLEALAREAEPNDDPEKAQLVGIPAAIAAGRDGEDDYDWFALDVGAPTTIEIITAPLVLGSDTRAYFDVFPTSGPCVGFDCVRWGAEEEGPGIYSLRGLYLETPGRYTIRVRPAGSITPYLLEIRHAEP